jgi:PmbA protein
MLEDLVKALKSRKDIAAWTVRHISTRGAQVYAVPKQTESRRLIEREVYKLDVLRQSSQPDGTSVVGSGDITLLPGDDIAAGIEQAVLVAGLVSNPAHGIPAPAPLPEVDLLDRDLEHNPAAVMDSVMESIRRAAGQEPSVHLSAAECFGEVETIHLLSSRGIDAQQRLSQIDIEVTLHSAHGDREVETYRQRRRRRVADLELESEIATATRRTLDLLEAGAPPSWQGAVLLRGEGLATFVAGDPLGGGVLQTLGSASSKYAKISSWEIGKSIFRGAVTGDPLSVWANRTIPYGTSSDRFDEEGLPAQRVQLIRANELATFVASQRYADYLELKPTGAFGGLELPAGQHSASALLAEPHVEIIQFSWFNPDPITGDFASEIRLGYFTQNGVRKPFKGGQLIGNFMDALANVHWSTETGFLGNYLGPHTARFNDLKVAGEGG